MKQCPRHIEAYAFEATHEFSALSDKYHHYFKIVCACGCTLFRLLTSNKASVKAVCDRCSSVLPIYDLASYPAATKLGGTETYSEMFETSQTPTNVFVGYEYGELDCDQDFNQDDITWCQVFVECSGSMIKVFDEETA